jgi:hypothetical protein
MGLAATEKAGHSREKTSASLLSARRRILGKLLLEGSDSTLRVRDSLLHYEETLDQQIGSGRNLRNLASNQLISLGIPGLVIGLAYSIEQTGYKITFFGCHIQRKTLFSTLTSFD